MAVAYAFNFSTGKLDLVPGANFVTNAMLRQSAGLSVIGRSANSTGDVADITAASDFQVFRRSGTSIGFGAVDLSQAAAVTGDLAFANLAQGAALSVLGVTGNSTADVASIAAASDHQVLRRSGTAVAFGAVALDQSAAVTGDLPYANLAQGSALSVLGVTGNATADNASIAAASDHQVLRRSGTAVAFGAVNLAQSAAVTGTLPVGNGGTGATTFTAGSVLFSDGTNIAQDNTNFFWDDSANKFRVGPNATDTDATFELTTDSGTDTIFIGQRSFAGAAGPGFIFRKSRATVGAPGQTLQFDTLGGMDFRGYQATTGAWTATKGLIAYAAAENFTSTAQGTLAVLQTTAIGGTAAATRACLTPAGNISLGSSITDDPTAGTACLICEDGTAPTTMATNTCAFYGNDVAGTVEAFARDEGGTSVQITSHNFTLFTPDPAEDLPLPDFYTRNDYLAVERAVDFTRLVRLVEALTGETLIHTRAIPRRDWVADQAEKVTREQAAYDGWREGYVQTQALLDAAKTDEERAAFADQVEYLARLQPPTTIAKAPPAWIAAKIPAIDATFRTRLDAVQADVERWKTERGL